METNTLLSKIKEVFKKSTSFFIFFSLFCVVIFFRGCDKDTPVNEIKTITDTLYVDKVIKIPEIKEVIVYKDPVPTDILVVGSDTVRRYRKVYTDSTGVATVTVTDSINGRLLGQTLDIKVKEREVKYKERVITNNTITKLKPTFVISAGLTASSGIRPTVGAEVGFKNRSGYNLELGYNNQKEITIGIKKDIFTFYNKNK